MLRQNSKAWVKKFKYQLSEWLPYGTFDHIPEKIQEHNGKYGEDYIIRGNNKSGYAVFTEGKGVILIS